MMKWIRILLAAFVALRRNVLRSALTTLGIIIGVGAVITMVEIGNGSSDAIQRQIASLGANMLMVFPGAASSGGISFGAGSNMTLTPNDADAIAKECPSVEAVAPIVRMRSGQAIYAGRNWVPGQSVGSTEAFFAVRDWVISDGAPFTARDVKNAACVCVVGRTVATQLFGGESPIGKEIRMQNVGIRVVGVLAAKGSNMQGDDQDDVVVIPWTTVKYRVSAASSGGSGGAIAASAAAVASADHKTYPGAALTLYPAVAATRALDSAVSVRFVNVDQIIVSAASSEELPAAVDEVTGLLHERHRIGAAEPDDFRVLNLTELMNTRAEVIDKMTNLLLIVAAISLVVGGVGIMNIMLVSVTERTKEIGLRMAVGAKANDILRQFLAEAVVLCLCGGLMGICAGRGSSLAVQKFAHYPVRESVWAILISVAVSALVGIAFGFYPAWKASRLDPIEALRYE